MRFIGDVHGDYTAYRELIKTDQPTVQVGDFGVGFGIPPFMAMKDRFIRGNHDYPAGCEIHPNWITDGTVEKHGPYVIGFVGGAYSVDFQSRVEGVTWWRDEELPYSQLQRIVGSFEAQKVDMVVSHCPPSSIAESLGQCAYSRTQQAFEILLDVIKPKIWIFGHHHLRVDQKLHGTQFYGLEIDGYLDFTIDE